MRSARLRKYDLMDGSVPPLDDRGDERPEEQEAAEDEEEGHARAEVVEHRTERSECQPIRPVRAARTRFQTWKTRIEPAARARRPSIPWSLSPH